SFTAAGPDGSFATWSESHGRAEAYRWPTPDVLLSGAADDVGTWPLPLHEHQRVEASLESALNPFGPSPPWDLVPDPTAASGGDVVTLSVRANGVVRLSFQAPEARWPKAPTEIRLSFVRPQDGREDPFWQRFFEVEDWR